MRRAGVYLVAGSAGVIAALPALPARAQSPCPAIETREAVVAQIDARLEIHLADGGLVRLYGVAPPAGAPPTFPLAGRDATIEFVDAASDRWGRRTARVYLAPAADADAPPDDLASLLVGQGAGLVRPEPGAPACLQPLLAEEANARAAGRGLWADPANAVIDARDRAALAARAGGAAIVEGVVASVGETAARLYLNFGPVRNVDFAASISKAAQKSFLANGIDPHSLIGARVRARGALEQRPAPSIDIAWPSALEIISRRAVSRQ